MGLNPRHMWWAPQGKGLSHRLLCAFPAAYSKTAEDKTRPSWFMLLVLGGTTYKDVVENLGLQHQFEIYLGSHPALKIEVLDPHPRKVHLFTKSCRAPGPSWNPWPAELGKNPSASLHALGNHIIKLLLGFYQVSINKETARICTKTPLQCSL